MEHLLSEGFSLMLFGMGFVFVFLTVLVIVTSMMSKLVTRYLPEPVAVPKARPAPAAPAKAAGNEDELMAVITAAVHAYRSK